MTTEFRVIQYRSGSRFVVNAVQVETAGSETVFGPASRDECDAFVRQADQLRRVLAAEPSGLPLDAFDRASCIPRPWSEG